MFEVLKWDAEKRISERPFPGQQKEMTDFMDMGRWVHEDLLTIKDVCNWFVLHKVNDLHQKKMSRYFFCCSCPGVEKNFCMIRGRASFIAGHDGDDVLFASQKIIDYRPVQISSK